MMIAVFWEDLFSNCAEMNCYEERLAVGMPGRHEATRTKVLVSVLSTFAVNLTDIVCVCVLSIWNNEGHWKEGYEENAHNTFITRHRVAYNFCGSNYSCSLFFFSIELNKHKTSCSLRERCPIMMLTRLGHEVPRYLFKHCSGFFRDHVFR